MNLNNLPDARKALENIKPTSGKPIEEVERELGKVIKMASNENL